MSFWPDTERAIEANSRSLSPAPRTGFVENTVAAWDATRFNDLFISEVHNEQEAFTNYIEEIYQATGRKIADPFLAATVAGVRGTNAEQSFIDSFFKQAQEVHDTGADFEFKTQDDLRANIQATAQALEVRRDEVASRATGAGVFGQFAGGVAATLTDPPILATLPLGAAGASGIIRTAIVEGLIAAGTEIAIQPQVQSYRDEIGLDAGVERALTNIAFAGLGGAAFGGALKSLGVMAGWAPKKLLAAFDQVVKKPTAEQRGARDAIEEINNQKKSNPYEEVPAARQEHERRTAEGVNAAIDMKVPDMPERAVTAHVQPKAIVNGDGVIKRFNPADIEIDAKRFQFKAEGDKFGVTERLKGVKEWDEIKSGVVVLWEDDAGKVFVADGHQRVALAKRLNDPEPIEETLISPADVPFDRTPILKDTRGEKRLFHGSSSVITKLEEYTFNELNFYGQGFYTTDAVDIAAGYTKKGSGQSPTLHEVTEKNKDIKFFDMEKKLDNDFKDELVENTEFGRDVFAEKEDIGLRDFFDEYRDIATGDGVSANDIQEEFEQIMELMKDRGFGGYIHKGGIRTGKKEHNVKIYFDPAKDLEIKVIDKSEFLVLPEGPSFKNTDIIKKENVVLPQTKTTKGIKINGFVLRSADGVTDIDTRVIAAAKNIAEGTGSAVDAAKVLRDAAGFEMNLPPSSVLVRQAQNLSRVSDDAFGMVVNELVPANYAALVGKLVDDEKLHLAIMQVLADAQPSNIVQAEAIVRQAQFAGASKEVQQTLFGTEEVTTSLFKDRARILDKSLKKLRQDKKVFKTLVQEDAKITSAGNTLDRSENLRQEVINGRAEEIIQRLAHRGGPIADALNAAARKAKQDGRDGSAINDFIAAVRAQSGRADFLRGITGERGRSGEAARQGGQAPSLDRIPDQNIERANLKDFDDPDGVGTTAQEEVAMNEFNDGADTDDILLGFDITDSGETSPKIAKRGALKQELIDDAEFQKVIEDCAL